MTYNKSGLPVLKYAETRQFGVVLQYNIVPNYSRWNLVINGRRQVPTSLLIPHLDQQPLVPIIIDIIGKWCIGQKLDFQKSPSSLSVGRFAAKQGSLSSPRGRLVASLGGSKIPPMISFSFSRVVSLFPVVRVLPSHPTPNLKG